MLSNDGDSDNYRQFLTSVQISLMSQSYVQCSLVGRPEFNVFYFQNVQDIFRDALDSLLLF